MKPSEEGERMGGGVREQVSCTEGAVRGRVGCTVGRGRAGGVQGGNKASMSVFW